VAAGDKVAITGFGVFEKAERAARTARNPATGEAIQVPASFVPRFRAGADFKDLVNDKKKYPDASRRRPARKGPAAPRRSQAQPLQRRGGVPADAQPAGGV